MESIAEWRKNKGNNKQSEQGSGTPGGVTSIADWRKGKTGGSDTKSQDDPYYDFNHGVDVFNYTMDSWNRWYEASRGGLESVGFGDAGDASAAIKDESASMLERLGQSRKWAQENKDLLGDNYDAIMKMLQQATTGTYWVNKGYEGKVEDFSLWDTQAEYDQYQADVAQRAEEEYYGTPGAMADAYDAWKKIGDARAAYDDLDEIKRYQMAGYGTVPEEEREALRTQHEQRLAEITETYGVTSPYDLMDLIYRMEEEYGQLQGQISDAENYQAGAAQNSKIAGWNMKYGGMDYAQLKQAMETVTDPQEKAWLNSFAGTKMTAADYDMEIASTKEQADAMSNYIDVLNARYGELDTAIANYSASSDPEDAKRLTTAQKELDTVLRQLSAAEDDYDALMTRAWQLEHDARFRTLRENDDFDDYSGYVVSITDDQGNVESTVDDPVYRYINSRGGELFPFIREGHKKEDYDWIEKNVAKYSKYTLMTDAEIEEMNYLYRTQGKQAASDYISWLSPTLDARAMGDLQESMAEMTANAPGWANALSVPLALSGGIGYLDIAAQNAAKKLTGSYQPINYNSTNMIPTIGARTVTETTAAMITDEYGVIDLDPEDHPYLAPILNGKGLADVYQLGMSAINSRVAALTGNPVLATMLLASSAATNGVLDALERGATDDQALTMGLLNGVAEYFFEKFEIEQLLGQDSSIVKAMLNQGLTEAFGEGMTSVANTIADAVIMADKSEYQTNVRKYIDEGLSPEEAKQKAFADIVIQVGWDAVGGFIMGAPGGASVSAINNVRQNQARAAMDKAITGYDVGQISKAASGRLVELGETENVELLAGALAKQAAGQKLTKAEKAAIKASTYGQQVAGELDPGRIRAGDKSSEWAESIGTIRTNAAEYSKRTKVDTTKDAARMLGIEDSFVKKVHGMAKDQNESTFATEFVMAYEMVKTGASKETLLEDQHLKNLTPEQRDVIFEAAKTEVEEYDTEYAYADDGKTSYQGKEVEVEGIAKAGKGKLTLKLSDGQTVDAADVVFGSDNDAVFYETMARMGVNTEDARKLAQGYAAAENKEEYTGAVASAYRYGRQGVSFESVPGGKVYRSVSEATRKNAHEMGLKAGRKTAANDQKKVGKKKPGTIKHYKNTTMERNGVHYDDVTADLTKLNAQQTEGVRLAEFLAKAGLDVHVFQSEMVDGKFTTDNGMYYSEDGSIHIDLNAGNRGQGTMAYTIAHEVTHFVRAWSPAKFRVYAEAVLEATGKTGADVSFMMDRKLLEIKKDPDYKDMTLRQQEDIAYEEVIAELSETMFTDTDVAQRIADRIREKDMGLFEKLKEFFRDLADRLRRAYSGLKPDSAIAREGRQALRAVEALRDAFAEAFVDAAESYRGAQEQMSTANMRGGADGAVVQSDAVKALTNGDVLKSTRTELEAMPKQVMSLSTGNGTIVNTIEGLTPTKITGLTGKVGINGFTGRAVRGHAMKASGFSQAQIRDVDRFMDTMAKFMEEAGVTYKFIGLQDVENAQLHYSYDSEGNIKSIVLSAMVKNGDYPVNFDLSSICKKRVAMSALIDKLAKRGSLDNGTVKLTPSNIFAINTALKNEGYETACLGCFVESKRYNSMKWAQTFCDKWNAAVKKVNPKATYFGYGNATFNEDSFTLEQAIKIEEAANNYIRATKTERLENAMKKYREKAAAGEPLVKGTKMTVDGVVLNTFSKAARDRLAKSDAISDVLKEKYLNCDVADLDLADVEFLLEAGVLPGASLSNKQAITEMVKSGEAYQHLLRPSDLLTDRGISKLEALPNFHGVLYGHYGSGTPKLMQSYTPYNSEIALLPTSKNKDQTLAEYLYSIAGVRMQSFSDFQVQNIYDYLQMVADLTAKKIPAHAYTKEISFAKLLGMTGIKVNLSVMFDIDPMADKAHAGLTKLNRLVHRGEYAKVVLEDEQGKWVYNIGDYQTQKLFMEAYPDQARRFLQSIGFADAVKLQTSPGYSANCGIIGVGYSDLGIFAMLNDNRIRYIIPYHASSLPADIKVATNIEIGTDYTPYQNNMKITEIRDSKGNVVNWSMKEAYKRLGSGQAVIKELNEKVRNEGWVVTTKKAQNGHGSYGLYEDLQQTGDPRKTAGNFMDWCVKNNTLPLFYQFASHENYYKMLYDFNVYDCVTEEYAPQQAVTNTYPTMVDGQVVPGDVTEGGFDAGYLQNTIDKQMAFMENYGRDLDEDLDTLAENVERGEYTLKSGRDSDGYVLKSPRGYDYTKPFYEQISDVKSGLLPSEDSLLIGTTPDVLTRIGLLRLPMTINQKHIKDSLFGTYKGTAQEVQDHLFTETELSTLPAKIADPIAVIWDKKLNSPKVSPSNVVVLVEMTAASGKQVVVPVQTGSSSTVNSVRINVNKASTVHGNTYSLDRLTEALNSYEAGKVSVFYVNNKKTTKVLMGTRNPIPSCLRHLDGFVHSISDPGSPVNIRIGKITDTLQFKEWFKGSKVVDNTGRPLVVYHGTSANFSVFRRGDIGFHVGTQAQAENRIEGVENGKVLPLYASIKNPLNVDTDFGDWHGKNVAGMLIEYEVFEEHPNREAIEKRLLAISRMEDNKHTDRTLRKYLISLGYDGIRYENQFEAEDRFSGDYDYSYIAFESIQLKSATDNNGTFDKGNPDIYYSKRTQDAGKTEAALQAENAQLKEDVVRLKELVKLQGQVTGGTKFTHTSVEAAAKILMRDAGAKGDVKELARLLNDFYAYIAKGNGLTWESVKEAAQPAVDWLMDRLKVTPADMDYTEIVVRQDVYESYWNVSTLKTVADVMQKRIDRLKGEHIRQMKELREKRDATIKALKKQHSEEVKAVRKELRADADRKVADIKKRNADSRKRAAEKRNEAMLRGKIQNTVKKLESLLVNETKKRNVKEGMKDLVETAITSADILWMDAGTDVDLIRNGIGTPLSERESQLLNETMDILAELDGLSNSPENADRKAKLQGQLYRKIQKLRDVLERERKRLNEATVSQALDALAKAYFEMGKSDDEYIRDVFQQGRYEYLTQLSSEIKGTLARDMTADQLQEVLFAYETVLHAVRNANKMFSENIKQNRRELGEAMIEEILNSGPEVSERSKAWIAANRFGWNNTKPVWATERIGSKTFEQLMGEIFKGQYLWATDMAEAQKFQQECAAKHGANSWDLEAESTFHSSTGREFKLTLDQIMSIYAYARREQAHDHLLRGGIVFPRSTETTVEKHGIKRTMLKRSARAYGLSMDIIEEIIDELKPEQIAYVNEMQKYLSETMGNKGNEVSRKMYGIPLFREKNYFPLMSAGEYMDRKREADFKKEQGQVSIANMGFTKPVVPKASNPVVLDGFSRVWSGHVNEMCLYHGLALPMEDYRRATGYATPNIEESDSLSVNSAIETIHGKEAVDYFDQLYRDLNGGAISDNRATFVARSTSKFKKAAVMLSNSVWVQQFSAIGRAGLLIDPKYFSNFAGKIDRHRVKKNWEQLKKYAPVAIIKDMGGFDTGMGRGASEFLMAKEYRDVNGWLKGLAKDKNHRDEVLGFMPAWSDRVTWCAIWDACKRETAQKYDIPVNSEAFLKKAGERFCEVVEKTQVYDSTLAKSANMRSKDTGMVALTAFMAEPTTTINMIEAAIRSKDGKRIGRALGAAAASILLNNLLASIVYAMRDDDEEETIIEKYTQAFISGMLDDINPLTYYPILKDIWSLLQGYDIERTDMAIWSDLTDSVKRAVSMLTKDTDDMSDEELAEHQKKVWDAMLGVLMYGANAFGVPLKNVVRDTKSYFNTVKTLSRGLDNNWRSWFDSAADAVTDSIPVIGLFGKESKQNRLFDAVRSGDEEYLGRMEGQYSSEKAAENAFKKEVKAQYADGKLTVEEASEMLMSYNGMTAKEALKQVLEWDFEAEYGFSYGDLKEQYQAGKISWEDAMEARITVGGERADKAGDTLDEWDFEADHGWAYEDRGTLYLKGDISKAQLVAALTGYGGMTQEEVDKYISEVEFKGEYGFNWDDRKYAYADGLVPEAVMRELLVENHGYTEDEADRYMVAYNWIKDNQRTDLRVDDVVSYTKILDDIDISIEGVGIDVDDYMAWKDDISKFSADYDSEGKSIPYSKINKAFPYIDSLDLTAEQKTALAIASGWAYSTVIGNKLW